MKLAIAIGFLALAYTPTSAQALAQSDSQSLIMAPPVQKPVAQPGTAEDEETFLLLKEARKTTSDLSKLVKCSSLAPKAQDLARYAEFLKQSESFLKVLSNVLTSMSLGLNIGTGNVDRTVDDVQTLAISEGGCALAGPFCSSFKLGMTLGALIDHAPKLLYWDANEQTIKEVVTDYYAPMFGDLVYGKPTVAELENRIAEMRAKAAKARAGIQKTNQNAAMCKKAEAKTAVQEILAKAKANVTATHMTPSDTGLSAQTDAAISTGRANADSAISAGNSQIMSTIEAVQQAPPAYQQSQPGASATSTCGGVPFTPSPGIICYRGKECIGTPAQCQALMDNLPPGSNVRRPL